MNLTVDLWDVGQGDCSVITLPDGRLFIIDVGPERSQLPDWLELGRHRSTKIYAIAITHNDEDHAGCIEHLLERWAAHRRIENVFVLQDRKPDQKTKRLLKAIIRYHEKGWLTMHRLEARKPVAPLYGFDGTDKLTMYAVYPEVAHAMNAVLRNAPKSNLASGIICLDINGQSQIIWPGDAPMQTISRFCSKRKPILIVGPHHGAPVKRDQKSYAPAFDNPDPQNVFISVGTTNIYQHPVPDFIKKHCEKGRTVFCSQLVHCDRLAVEKQRHVMNQHLRLELLPPHDQGAVTCRGPVRMSWNSSNGTFEFDGFHQEHRNKVKGLHDALCEY